MSLVEQAIAKLRGAEQSAQALNPAPGLDQRPSASPKWDPTATDPMLGSANLLNIDSGYLREAGYLPELAGERQISEHYRQIKRPLVERAISTSGSGSDHPDARVIMVTSGLPGEGKTFTSINLAYSLARERDISVLLVDADILKPHVSEIFGVAQNRGLMSALSDPDIPVESLVLRTNVRGLSILPAGRSAEGAAEQLLSNRMREILGQLFANNPRRIVLLDSPPLLVTSEGPAITKIAGQVVLVVRVGKTPEQVVKDAIALLDVARFGGIVVNDARLSLSESYYGYGKYGNQSGGYPA